MCVLARTVRPTETHRVLRPTPNSGAMASCSMPKARAHTWRTKQSAHDGGCVLLRWARCLFAHVTFHVTLAGQSIVQRRQMAPTQPWLRLAAIGRPVSHARKHDAAHSRVHDTAAPHPPSHCKKGRMLLSRECGSVDGDKGKRSVAGWVPHVPQAMLLMRPEWARYDCIVEDARRQRLLEYGELCGEMKLEMQWSQRSADGRREGARHAGRQRECYCVMTRWLMPVRMCE